MNGIVLTAMKAVKVKATTPSKKVLFDGSLFSPGNIPECKMIVCTEAKTKLR